jgi:hypothetical protein
MLVFVSQDLMKVIHKPQNGISGITRLISYKTISASVDRRREIAWKYTSKNKRYFALCHCVLLFKKKQSKR